MTTKDLEAYLGGPCQVRLHCRACGSFHVLDTELEHGPNVGEVLLAGHRYSVEDIDDVRVAESPRLWTVANALTPLHWAVMLFLLAVLMVWTNAMLHR